MVSCPASEHLRAIHVYSFYTTDSCLDPFEKLPAITVLTMTLRTCKWNREDRILMCQWSGSKLRVQLADYLNVRVTWCTLIATAGFDDQITRPASVLFNCAFLEQLYSVLRFRDIHQKCSFSSSAELKLCALYYRWVMLKANGPVAERQPV